MGEVVSFPSSAITAAHTDDWSHFWAVCSDWYRVEWRGVPGLEIALSRVEPDARALWGELMSPATVASPYRGPPLSREQNEALAAYGQLVSDDVSRVWKARIVTLMAKVVFERMRGETGGYPRA